jgi:fermentation-respiration switch protein FrsA (DUF1100 family)
MVEFLGTAPEDALRNVDADLVLVAGEDDEICQAWQSEDATEALRSHGLNATRLVITGGNHSNVIFKGHVEGESEWVDVPDDPVGNEVVQFILDAIAAATPEKQPPTARPSRHLLCG